MVALAERHAELSQRGELSCGLDSLRDEGEARTTREGAERLDQRLLDRVYVDVTNDSGVELELLWRMRSRPEDPMPTSSMASETPDVASLRNAGRRTS